MSAADSTEVTWQLAGEEDACSHGAFTPLEESERKADINMVISKGAVCC